MNENLWRIERTPVDDVPAAGDGMAVAVFSEPVTAERVRALLGGMDGP